MRSRLCLLLVGEKKKKNFIFTVFAMAFIQFILFVPFLYLFFVLCNTFNYDDSFSSGTFCQHFFHVTRSMSRTHVDYVHIFSAFHFSVFSFPVTLLCYEPNSVFVLFLLEKRFQQRKIRQNDLQPCRIEFTSYSTFFFAFSQ